MNKTELIEAISKSTKLTKKDVSAVIEAYHDTVKKTLKKNDKVQIIGFGTFETSKRAARKGRNPQTGAEIKIAAAKVAKFKPGKALKDAIK